MLGDVWNFLKRNKMKFVWAGAISGGTYLLWKYAGWKIEEWKEREEVECLANAKRQHHFDCNQRTCNTTVLSMLPKLRGTIKQRIDCERIISEIKTRPENKIDLWSELKIMSFTRTVVTVYSTTLLAAFVRVQLNILGGYMYIDSCLSEGEQVPATMHAPPEVQHDYLGRVQFLMSDGLNELIKTVTEAVENVLGGVALQDCLTLHDMEECISKLRGQVEVLSSDNDVLLPGNMIHPLGRYMLGSEGLNGEQSVCKLASSQDSLQNLMQETRDIIESNDFRLVLNDCLDAAFSRLLDNLAHFFRPSTPLNGSHPDYSPYKTKLPLAKVAPMVNGQMFVLCSDAPNQFVQELLLFPRMKDFAANVYESFSQVQSIGGQP